MLSGLYGLQEVIFWYSDDLDKKQSYFNEKSAHWNIVSEDA